MRQGWLPGWLVVGLGLSITSGPAPAQPQAQVQTPAANGLVLPDAMLGNQVAPMLLLTRPEVRAELGLTAEQAESARKVLVDLRAQAEAIRGKGNDPTVIARRRAIDEAQARWLHDNLDAEQTRRLGQVDLQWQGPWALSRPLAAEMLGLSDEQAAKVRRLLAESPSSPTVIDRVIAVLTPAQQERWRGLQGKPVAFTRGRTDPAIGKASAPAGKPR